MSCSSQVIPFPVIPGADVISLLANPVTNFTRHLGNQYVNHFEHSVANLDFCNVSLQYTHKGKDDTVNVQIWLPLEENWNDRLQGVGGGGFAAGLFSLSDSTMTGAVSEGYAAFSTDAGHNGYNPDPSGWAVQDNGELDMQLLENFAYLSLKDAALIGKSVTESFYGRSSKYTYWNGCSTGGRQGLMIAQRYPNLFDGILASAPANNWARFIVAELWPQLIMSLLGEFPRACELEALTAFAVVECDSNDGVVDGIISDSDSCDFDPHRFVGQQIKCTETDSMVEISAGAAIVVQETWHGARSENNSFLWYGLNHEAALTGGFNLVNTDCQNGKCTNRPFPISNQWIRIFVEKNPAVSVASMTRGEYEKVFHKSVREYTGLISADNPDLSAFRRLGGKMITWHGLADPVIFPKGMRHYYESVLAADPSAPDFYRYFEAPGVGHCAGGRGAFPGGAMDTLIAWVEQGKAPSTLHAVSAPDENDVVNHRPLCPYPSVARYRGTGDTSKFENFYCAESHLSTTPVLRLAQRLKDYIRTIL